MVSEYDAAVLQQLEGCNMIVLILIVEYNICVGVKETLILLFLRLMP